MNSFVQNHPELEKQLKQRGCLATNLALLVMASYKNLLIR